MLHHWNKTLDDSQLIRVLFIDYAKAFDHVKLRIGVLF